MHLQLSHNFVLFKGKIIIFYIFFFAGLAAFFLLMLYIFFLTLDLQKPKWQMTNGLIGDNPGVGFRPQPDQDKNVDSTLIWFERNSPKNFEFWSKQLDTWFQGTFQSSYQIRLR